MENVVIRPFIKILPRHKALIKSSLLLLLTPRDFNSFLLFLTIAIHRSAESEETSQYVPVNNYF